MFFRFVFALQFAVQLLACKDSEFITKWTLWESPGPGLAATVHVPVTQEIFSWGIELEFNKEFSKLQFFNGLSQVTEGSVFNVTNESWSGHKQPGDIIAFSLLGDYVMGEVAEDIDILRIGFNGNQLCAV